MLNSWVHTICRTESFLWTSSIDYSNFVNRVRVNALCYIQCSMLFTYSWDWTFNLLKIYLRSPFLFECLTHCAMCPCLVLLEDMALDIPRILILQKKNKYTKLNVEYKLLSFPEKIYNFWCYYSFFPKSETLPALSAGIGEYADCISAEKQEPPQVVYWQDTKPSHVDVLELGFWGMWSTNFAYTGIRRRTLLFQIQTIYQFLDFGSSTRGERRNSYYSNNR